jgi:RNA-directed DNA polymerase
MEPRNHRIRGADAVKLRGRPHPAQRQRELDGGPARSKTRSTCRTFLRENREIPHPLVAGGATGRTGKVGDRKPVTHGRGKSDGPEVPAKPPNEVAYRTEEVVEGRGPTKENAGQQNALRTQSRLSAPSALDRVRTIAVKDKSARFTALLHHVTIDLLRTSFLSLQRGASPGVDGVTWEQYRVDLEGKFRDLHGRLHQGVYRAKPSRRVFIAKPDGRERPLGIASLEDKLVQRALATVLNAIYEGDFLGFSYGFRPGAVHIKLWMR